MDSDDEQLIADTIALIAKIISDDILNSEDIFYDEGE